MRIRVIHAGFLAALLLSSALLHNSGTCQNLVVNGSFESITGCPDQMGQLSLAEGWVSAHAQETVELYHRCGKIGYNGVSFSCPNTWAGYQEPFEGDAFAAFGANVFQGGFYEYLQYQLPVLLVPGGKYIFSMWVSVSDVLRFRVTAMGMAFSDSQVNTGYYSPGLSIPVSLRFKDACGIGNETIWYRLSGEFVATGVEKFILIGAFPPYFSPQVVDQNCQPAGSQLNQNAYYFVDAVSIIPANTPILKASAGPDRMICRSESISLSMPYHDGYRYEWIYKEMGSQVVSRDNDLHLTPNRDATVILKVVDPQYTTTYDTVFIRVLSCIDLTVPNVITPNGDGLNDEFQVLCPEPDVSWDLSIYNRWGNCVFQSGASRDHWDGKHKGENVPAGTYFYHLVARSPDPEVKVEELRGTLTVLY